MTAAISPYSFFTNWADTGLIADPIFSEKSLLSPLRNALFKNEPLLKDIGTINKTKRIVLMVLFVIAFAVSPFVNCVQHAFSSTKLVLNAPFNRKAYPELKNDHWLTIICSGVLCFPFVPIFAILSTLGSIFKTLEQQTVST